ncbi:MAG: MptD family putative ECF transporter S component [Anaerotignum sp.]|nr:MptD family putative ECF transporter S component [Anaerotignum sp.]
MEKLKVKDLISIGLFGTIYLVIFFVGISVLGGSPYTYFFGGAVVSLVAGPVFMLFIARMGRRFSILILGGLITTLIALMFGGMWTVLLIGYVSAIIAEVVAAIGKYKSFRFNTLSYIFFSYWPFGVYSAFWILKDKMRQSVESGNYGEGYADKLDALTTPGMMLGMILAVIVCATISSFLGKALLKKHFERAGIA